MQAGLVELIRCRTAEFDIDKNGIVYSNQANITSSVDIRGLNGISNPTPTQLRFKASPRTPENSSFKDHIEYPETIIHLAAVAGNVRR